MDSSRGLPVLVIEAFAMYRKDKPLVEELPVMLAGGGFDVLLATPNKTAVALRLKMAIAAGRPCQAVIVERLFGESIIRSSGDMVTSLVAAFSRLRISLPVFAVLVDPGENQILSMELDSCKLSLVVDGISDADLPGRLLEILSTSES